jgi:hypothetical protein
MRKIISAAYSKLRPKANGDEYSTKELILAAVTWFALLLVLFTGLKFLLDWFHLK